MKLIAFALVLFAASASAQPRKTLDIYVIDVEGGNATLFVSPSGESLLIDAGNAGPAAVRDADRIVAATKAAGITQIDHHITTHYHGDHFGGLSELAARIPIKEFIDHGPNVQPAGPADEFVSKVYPALYARAKHTVVKPGDRLFLNDGLVQLVVDRIEGGDVHCTTVVGGELRSRKGLNLPGINLGISAFTERDRECLEFALNAGVDAVSQSFVERASDIEALRTAAAKIGRVPFIIAKIERSDALKHYDEILDAADGIMVARGDLGVEVPIEEITDIQKFLITKANLAGKPVITATQMLESMISSRLPTRAEATDVANSILDGTDCVMLSGESAMGKFPEEAVTMLAKIAAFTETHRVRAALAARREALQKKSSASPSDRMATVIEHALDNVPCDAVLVPTRGGSNARVISRCKPLVWVIATARRRGNRSTNCVITSSVASRSGASVLEGGVRGRIPSISAASSRPAIRWVTKGTSRLISRCPRAFGVRDVSQRHSLERKLRSHETGMPIAHAVRAVRHRTVHRAWQHSPEILSRRDARGDRSFQNRDRPLPAPRTPVHPPGRDHPGDRRLVPSGTRGPGPWGILDRPARPDRASRLVGHPRGSAGSPPGGR